MPADEIRVANAPVSFGAFELTVGVLPNVPSADRVLTAIADAGYEGTELGAPGYLGDLETLRAHLEQHGLALAGGYVPLRFGEPDEDLAVLDETLDLFDAAGGLRDNLSRGRPRPVLADDGARGGDIDWKRLADGVARAAARARERGYEPTFHPHMGTRIQTPDEIERLLETTDVPLLLDSGHLLAGGGDPVQGLRDWRARIDHVHVKDVDLGLLRGAASWPEAWRAGAFCELGTGDVDLAGFLAELDGYSGWLVVEQDWVPGPDDDPEPQIEAQRRNREWLAEHAGL
ncbi:MAG TPA: sugar phosphate isomerase/epimerase [Gaiellaceae bacterium]|nr:sugar phosphate isomerase/epimerase [Gaiellaceae bacterium]